MLDIPKPRRLHSYIMSYYLISQGVYPSPKIMELDYVNLKGLQTIDQYITCCTLLQKQNKAARNLRKLVKQLTRVVKKRNPHISDSDIMMSVVVEAFDRACKLYMETAQVSKRELKRRLVTLTDMSDTKRVFSGFAAIRFMGGSVIAPVDITHEYLMFCKDI